MSRPAEEYLRHILGEVKFVEEKLAGLSEDSFMGDEVLQRAFARSLEIIGEANRRSIGWK